MSLILALYQPDIPPNTGTMLRLGASLGIPVHIIHPTGFPFTRQILKRSGMDYLDIAEVVEHTNFLTFLEWLRSENRRLVLLSTKGEVSAYEAEYKPGDVLMMGRESVGVPDSVAQEADLCLRIPMRGHVRSLNVAVSAGIVLGEAMRQIGAFKSLE